MGGGPEEDEVAAAVTAPGPHEGVVRGDLTRSADLLREGRGLLLDLVDRAEARDAAASWTGRVNTVTPRTDRVDADALLIRPHGCLARALPTGAGPRRHHAGACAGHMVRPTGLSTALTVASGSLARK
ncbi:hypothetical protein [Streptomyces phaeochromogenes]|uniref:aromatic-ring hydroxylase C-terminal domain-containing protein n=1 Tax=Streptomyces phaeochromogenes TaxID=1923 RepID=UPI00386A42D7